MDNYLQLFLIILASQWRSAWWLGRTGGWRSGEGVCTLGKWRRGDHDNNDEGENEGIKDVVASLTITSMSILSTERDWAYGFSVNPKP